eukprot:2106437-Prymnesium_polylepis.1
MSTPQPLLGCAPCMRPAAAPTSCTVPIAPQRSRPHQPELELVAVTLWAAAVSRNGMHGRRLTMTNDEAMLRILRLTSCMTSRASLPIAVLVHGLTEG